jgi:hypothetical protein
VAPSTGSLPGTPSSPAQGKRTTTGGHATSEALNAAVKTVDFLSIATVMLTLAGLSLGKDGVLRAT